MTGELDELLSPAGFFACLYCICINHSTPEPLFSHLENGIKMSAWQALGNPGKEQAPLLPGRLGTIGSKCTSDICEKVARACKRKILAFPRLIIQRAQKQVPPFFTFSSREFPVISLVLIEGGHRILNFQREEVLPTLDRCLFSFLFALFICFLRGLRKKGHGFRG